MRKGSVGIIHSQFVLGDSRSLVTGKLDSLSVAVHCRLEVVVLEFVVALLFALLALD